MKTKPLSEIKKRIDEIHFQEGFDLLVAIERGGVNPAKLLSEKLNLAIKTIKINYRDDEHNIIRGEPKLLQEIGFNPKNKIVLLVDDVSRTGSTLEKAKRVLDTARLIKTCVVNGEADYSLYDEECFRVNWEK